jgi:DNA-binding winged helix-turn-helix (wHTH) protein
MPDDSLLRPALQPFRRQPPARIGAFEVRAPSNELIGPAGVRRLRPRLMDVLLRLAAAAGQVVPRQVLLDEVWPRRLVADEVLSRAIAELRTLLDDDARESRYIETLPKVGYRLIAPVAAARTTDGAVAASADAPAAAPVAPGAVVTRPSARFAAHRNLVLAAVATVLVATYAGYHVLAREDADALPALDRQLGNALQFSSDLEMEMAPRFSADATKVAFTLGDMERAHVVVQDVATRKRVSLPGSDRFQTSPVFFPDGQRLAYFRENGGDYGIVERSLVSGAERVLVPAARRPVPFFDLAPDGRRLVYATRERDTPGLRLLDLDTGRVTTLTSPRPEQGLDLFPRFSPDGTRIAFVRGPELMRDVWVAAADGSSPPRAVGSPRGLTWGLAWLGRDGPLLVSADWFGGRALNVLDTRTGRASLAGARGAQYPDASHSGDVVYEAAAYQANLHLMDTADPERSERILWPSAKYSNYPNFSPDGRSVVFDSNRDNPISIFLGVLGADAHRLPLPADYEFGEAHWSNDGRLIYGVRGARNGASVTSQAVRIDPQTAQVEVIDALGDMVGAVRESADAKTLYYSVSDGTHLWLWRASAADPAQREQLPLPAISEFEVKGGRLAYRAPRADDITLCELPVLKCAPAGVSDLGGSGIAGWALTRGALWVRMGQMDQAGELVRFDLAQRKVTTRMSVGATAIGANVAVSPDERQVVVAVQERVSIDLMLAPRLPADVARVARK